MIFVSLTQQLNSLIKLIETLSENQYYYKSKHLSNSSIGNHTRHIIELLQCAIKGYNTGVVDYVNRIRDLKIEKDKSFALDNLNSLINNAEEKDKVLLLLTDCENNIQDNYVSTTYYREIVYNTEHIIHHLALIKVALVEMNLNIVEESFGMAYSTIKYKTLPTS